MPSKKNSQFDERQIEIRNRVGHQCFFILYFLLLLDLLVADYGIKLAGSPVSIVIIMLSCFGYYLIRIIWAGAYTGEGSKKQKYRYVILCLIAAITTLIAIAKKTNFFTESFSLLDPGLLRVLLFFFIFFAVVIVSRNISNRRSN